MDQGPGLSSVTRAVYRQVGAVSVHLSRLAEWRGPQRQDRSAADGVGGWETLDRSWGGISNFGGACCWLMDTG